MREVTWPEANGAAQTGSVARNPTARHLLGFILCQPFPRLVRSGETGAVTAPLDLYLRGGRTAQEYIPSARNLDPHRETLCEPSRRRRVGNGRPARLAGGLSRSAQVPQGKDLVVVP